jgi:hypothetical protein
MEEAISGLRVEALTIELLNGETLDTVCVAWSSAWLAGWLATPPCPARLPRGECPVCGKCPVCGTAARAWVACMHMGCRG